MYPNNYRETRCKFIVGEIKNMRVKKRNEQKDIVVLTLRFKNLHLKKYSIGVPGILIVD